VPLASAGLLLGGLTATVVGVTQLGPWGVPRAAVCLVVGLALLGAFARHELRATRPLVPLDALREPALRACLAALFAIQFIVLGLTVHLVLFLEHGLGVTALASGAVLALSGLGTPLLSTTTGRWTDRHGARRLVLGGLLLAAGGLGWLALTAPARDLALLVPGLVAISLARPAVFTPAGVAPTVLLPEAERGFAASLVTESRQLGAVLGVAVLGAVSVAVVGSGASPPPPAEQARGFAVAMAVAAVVGVAAAAVVYRSMPRRVRG
jgi:MFS transporter, DHA2 family, methylenomycin A resistance protein